MSSLPPLWRMLSPSLSSGSQLKAIVAGSKQSSCCPDRRLGKSLHPLRRKSWFSEPQEEERGTKRKLAAPPPCSQAFLPASQTSPAQLEMACILQAPAEGAVLQFPEGSLPPRCTACLFFCPLQSCTSFKAQLWYQNLPSASLHGPGQLSVLSGQPPYHTVAPTFRYVQVDLQRNGDCKPTVLRFSSHVTQMGRAWLWTWRLGILWWL